MSPENKQTILRSYECQLKASSKPETKKALESIISDIKGIQTSDELKVVHGALECVLALDMPYKEGHAILSSHGLQDNERVSTFSNTLSQSALDILKKSLNINTANQDK